MKILYDIITGEKYEVTNSHYKDISEQWMTLVKKIEKKAVKEKRCKRCGKKLTNNISSRRGMGPVCQEKINSKKQRKIEL